MSLSSKSRSGKQMQQLTLIALLAAAGILLQVLESFVPVVMIIPGYKIGLANIASLYALYALGPQAMVIVSVLRIFLAGLATGSLFSVSFMLSVSGGTLSLLTMWLLWRSHKFTIYGVSAGGAGAHALGQVLAVSWIYRQFFMQLFLPVLLALSIVSGLAIAFITSLLLKRTRVLLPAGDKKQTA